MTVMLLAAAANPGAFLEMQQSGWIWAERHRLIPALYFVVLSPDQTPQGSKLGRDVTGSSFPSHPSAGPLPLVIQEGHWCGYTSDFSMQSCISAPCFNFLPHQCSPCATLSISVHESKHSSSLGVCAGEMRALGAEGQKEPSTNALFLLSQGWVPFSGGLCVPPGIMLEFPMCQDRELVLSPWHRLLLQGLFPLMPHQNSLSAAAPLPAQAFGARSDQNFPSRLRDSLTGQVQLSSPVFPGVCAHSQVCQQCWGPHHEKRSEKIKYSPRVLGKG